MHYPNNTYITLIWNDRLKQGLPNRWDCGQIWVTCALVNARWVSHSAPQAWITYIEWIGCRWPDLWPEQKPGGHKWHCDGMWSGHHCVLMTDWQQCQFYSLCMDSSLLYECSDCLHVVCLHCVDISPKYQCIVSCNNVHFQCVGCYWHATLKAMVEHKEKGEDKKLVLEGYIVRPSFLPLCLSNTPYRALLMTDCWYFQCSSRWSAHSNCPPSPR